MRTSKAKLRRRRRRYANRMRETPEGLDAAGRAVREWFQKGGARHTREGGRRAVFGHEPGMRTSRRWWCFWQRRVPVVVPESLVRGALRSARINEADRFNAELRRRTRQEGATA